jgi:hypothetical protein
MIQFPDYEVRRLSKLVCLLVSLLVWVLPLQAAEKMSKVSEKDNQASVLGWIGETRAGDFEIGIDPSEKHSGSRSGYLKSRVEKPKEFGNLMQSFVPLDFLGKRVKMSVWVKSNITGGSAHCWARVDGPWIDKDDGIKFGSFDNMTDRPIAGTTDWTQYRIVIDIPEESTDLWFGCMLSGTGQVWLDDFSFEVVSKDVPLTGISSGEPSQKQPLNLNFEAEHASEKAGAKDLSNFVYGWNADHDLNHFEMGIDPNEKHTGMRSAYVKSLTQRPPAFGNIDQGFIPTEQLGKRIRMSAWVKSNLTSGSGQLWLRIDRPSNVRTRPGLFDNMDDRPIKGMTGWTQYNLVCDVPTDSNLIAFGLMLIGEGQVWLDDVQFESVGKDVPLTGILTQDERPKTKPINTNFEE